MHPVIQKVGPGPTGNPPSFILTGVAMNNITDSPHRRKVAVELVAGEPFRSGVATTLSASDPAARNSLSSPNAIQRMNGQRVEVSDGRADL